MKPLQNIVAEQIVLGALLNSAQAYWQVADVLMPEHFARPIHQQIYRAIKDLLTEGNKLSQALIESRVGSEYEDGKLTSSLLSALVVEAEDQQAALDSVDDIVDLWRQRKLIEFGEGLVKAAQKDNANSLDLLTAAEEKLKDISLNSQAEPIHWIGDIAATVITRSSKTKESGVTPGFDTGLPSLDEIIGRLHGGDLGYIGAKPGDAKTILAAQIARRAAAYGPVAIFELEMQKEDLAAREITVAADVSVADIEAGSYDAWQHESMLEALGEIRKLRIAVDDRPRLTIEQIHNRCLTLKRRHGLIACFIDHHRLVRTSQRAADKWERSEIVTGLSKAFAKSLGIAVTVLSQVTRASQRRDDPIPQLNDFDGGPSIEQDADWAVSLFRRDRWLKSQRPQDPNSDEFDDWARDIAACRNKIRITALKRRRGDDQEHRDFNFDGRRSRITEIDK